MDSNLKVLISGTGFAGQGHADAFRAAGVDVVGIVGRTASVVSEVATKMAIPYSGTNSAIIGSPAVRVSVRSGIDSRAPESTPARVPPRIPAPPSETHPEKRESRPGLEACPPDAEGSSPRVSSREVPLR